MNRTNTFKKRPYHPILVRLLEIFVALVFSVSCLSKIGDVAGFASLITRYGFPSLSSLAPIIVIFEALCAIFLFLDIYPKITSAIAGIMLIFFTGAFFYASTYEGISDCGCFGNLVENIPPWLTYLRNSLLLVSTILIIVFTPIGYSKSDATRWIIIALLMVFVIYETGHTYKKAPRYKQSHPLFRQPIKNTALNSYVKTHPDSTYLLYVFSYECADCIDGLNNIKEYDKLDVIDRLIGLPVTEDKDSVIHHEFDLTFDEIPVGLGLQGVVTGIPLLLYVEHDTIRYVIEGAVPSPYNFRKFYLE